MLALFIVGATLLSAWRVSERSLFWDDFLIPAKYANEGFPAFPELFAPHDGHLMPGAIALQSAVSLLAPLQWWLPALMIVTGTVLSTVIWWCSLGRKHPWALTALVFSPFLGAALGWWSAAINALGWQITCGLSVLLLRRYATTKSPIIPGLGIAMAVLMGLLFSERALSIIPVLTVFIVIFPRFWDTGATSRRPLLTLVVPGWVLTFGWAGLYAWILRASEASCTQPLSPQDSADGSGVVFSAIPRGFLDAILPGVVGGPWRFERWTPGMSFANPPTLVATIASVVVGLCILAWILVSRGHRKYVAAALVISAGYLVFVFLALLVARSGVGTTDLITRSMHYYADWFSVSVLAATTAHAYAHNAPDSQHKPHKDRSFKFKFRAPVFQAPVFQATVAVLFIASSAISNWGFVQSWQDDPTPDWLHNVTQSLQASKAPLLPQPVPYQIAGRFGDANVDIGDIAAGMRNWPGVSMATTDPQFLLDDGRLVAAGVLESARNTAEKPGTCGQRIPIGKPTVVELNHSLPFGEWTWELHTTATSPVTLRIVTPNGLETYADSLRRASYVSVPQQLTKQFVRVAGGGGQIELLATVHGKPAAAKPGNQREYLCLGSGAIGPLLPK